MQRIGWLWETNFAPFLEFAAALSRYELSEEELLAYQTELQNSNEEADHWVLVELIGNTRTSIEVAKDPETSVVHVRINSDARTKDQLEAVAGFLSVFSASKLSVPPDG